MDSYTKTHSKDVFCYGNGEYVTNGNGIHPSGQSVIHYTDTISGSKNPRWKDEVRLLQNATTPLSATLYNVEPTFASLGWWYLKTSNTNPNNRVESTLSWDGILPLSRWIGFCGNPSTTVSNRVRDTALRRFLARCDSVRSSVESGQDFGEWRETLNSVARPMHSVRDYTVSYLESLLKAKHRRPRLPLPRVLSDAYLEWHFGVSPLLSDIANAFADVERYRFPVYPVQGSANERYNGTAGESGNLTPDGFSGLAGAMRVRFNSYGTYSVRYKGMYKSGADAQGRIGRLQDWQLTIPDFVPTAWDLLPFSWLVDMFTNVGDILRALCFIRSNLAWSVLTVHQEEQVNVGDVKLTTGPPGPTLGYTIQSKTWSSGVSSTYSRKTLSRTIPTLTDFIPAPEFRLPSNGYQWADIAAVLTQRISRIVPFF